MNSKLLSKKTVIGAVHFMPLPGFEGHKGMDDILNKARLDTNALVNGEVDALIFENNYDYPHTILITDLVEKTMIELIKNISPKIDFGISVLWNDYRAALRIAKETRGKFIRVPVFVDRVKTQYGIVEPSAEGVITYRKEIGAEEILILTDIHVKHAELLSDMPIHESAQKAIKSGSDGLIITGKWTAESPSLKDLEEVRKSVGNFPVLVGSGANKDNIADLLVYADGVIVSTSLKTGKQKRDNVNVKGYSERIDLRKVKEFVKASMKTTEDIL